MYGSKQRQTCAVDSALDYKELKFSEDSRTSLSAWSWDYALREVYAFREVHCNGH